MRPGTSVFTIGFGVHLQLSNNSVQTVQRAVVMSYDTLPQRRRGLARSARRWRLGRESPALSRRWPRAVGLPVSRGSRPRPLGTAGPPHEQLGTGRVSSDRVTVRESPVGRAVSAPQGQVARSEPHRIPTTGPSARPPADPAARPDAALTTSAARGLRVLPVTIRETESRVSASRRVAAGRMSQGLAECFSLLGGSRGPRVRVRGPVPVGGRRRRD